MPVYTAYILDERGQTKPVPHMLTAIKQSQQFVGRYGLKLWDRDRLVAFIEADRQKRKL
jgi:hypothetical protein